MLEEAAKLVSGERRESYGDYAAEAEKVAAGWSKLLNFEVPARKVPLMMAWLKLVREAHAHKRDNLADLAGYAKLAQDIAEPSK